MSDLKDKLIKLGADHRDLRPHIRPILAELDKSAGILKPYYGWVEDANGYMRYLVEGTSKNDVLRKLERYDRLVQEGGEVKWQKQSEFLRTLDGQRSPDAKWFNKLDANGFSILFDVYDYGLDHLM